jgi:uncharacterized protein
MLSHTRLAYELRDGLIVPFYLTARDESWIQSLIDELDALVGRTQGDAARIFGEKTALIAASHDVPIAAVRMVQQMLERLWRARPATGIPSRKIRRVVFELGADRTMPRDDVIRRAADALGIRAEQVSDGLFADRSSERRLAAPSSEPTPTAVLAEYNVALVQEFLLRAEQVVAHVGAHAAAVLRVLKQRGLMYHFTMGARGAVLTLPGPASLFRQTLRYGRALAALFPAIARAPGWSLEAKCLLGAKMVRFHAGASDPITAPPLPEADNVVERRLVRDFRRIGSPWTIAPASDPLRTSGGTFFPDFVLERGIDRVLVEIVGFHTGAYLKNRSDALRSAGLTSVVLCVDDALVCSELPATALPDVFHFETRIEAGRLLGVANRLSAEHDTAPDSDQPSS